MFVDVLTPELRAQMTPEEWKIWKRINARPAKALAAYPDLERQDFDETLDQTAAAAALRPMPVVVLTASDKFIDVVPKLIQAGELPPDTPPDFGAIVDRANSAAQNELGALVLGAVHITDTHSGHNMMIDNAPVVIQAILWGLSSSITWTPKTADPGIGKLFSRILCKPVSGREGRKLTLPCATRCSWKVGWAEAGHACGWVAAPQLSNINVPAGQSISEPYVQGDDAQHD